jgi:carboxymethylenebutenolidase
MRIVAAAFAVVLALAATIPLCAADWTPGTFQSNGEPVEEHHCVPAGAGPFPAVIMLHGAGARDAGSEDFEDYCSKLADHGYYTEFIEYYSQTSPASVGNIAGMMRDFPTWTDEIRSGVAALKQNPAVNPQKIGLMGFSLGAYLSLAYGATHPNDIAAIVDYYGGLTQALYPRASTMPPVLIIHGEIDRIVPVSQAIDLDAALTKAGRPHEMKIYPGAEHAFNFPEAVFWYKPGAANDAWNRSLKFFDTYLKGDSK